ncbi:DNase I-like protein [Dendrothele bispora CBS 962.96]|uniref:DNase I-like protein n=1 Tax=Dendrothele bispora (strain CBS 962.96) TaxID=1314807 RepID=A0A4V4HFP8_DENBC|nr:DNase I-like protein [Dendrothele bispora CBS 962.96]
MALNLDTRQGQLPPRGGNSLSVGYVPNDRGVGVGDRLPVSCLSESGEVLDNDRRQIQELNIGESTSQQAQYVSYDPQYAAGSQYVNRNDSNTSQNHFNPQYVEGSQYESLGQGIRLPQSTPQYVENSQYGNLNNGDLTSTEVPPLIPPAAYGTLSQILTDIEQQGATSRETLNQFLALTGALHAPSETQGTNPETQTAHTGHQLRNNKKHFRAAIRVASLNMRGYGNPNALHRDNKWNHINQLVREKRIGILALQETHLTSERHEQIEKVFSKRLKIFFSSDPENPTGRAGVAIVLNKELVKTNNIKTYQIVPGRALLLQAPTHKDSKINLLVVYAPNVTSSNGTENAEFWNKIHKYYEEKPNTPKPHILLGDLNVVEDGLIDRLPAHDDPEDALEALDDLKMLFNIKDGWRNTYPTTKSFTFMQSSTGSQSQIDRIYITDKFLKTAREWKIEQTGIPHADHKMTSVQISNEDSPYVGKGRWKFPNHILKDKELLNYIHKRGIEAEKELNTMRSTARTIGCNPQKIWYNLKMDIIKKAKERAKIVMPKLLTQIRETQTNLDQVINDTTIPEDIKIERARELQTEITNLERKRHETARRDVAV